MAKIQFKGSAPADNSAKGLTFSTPNYYTGPSTPVNIQGQPSTNLRDLSVTGGGRRGGGGGGGYSGGVSGSQVTGAANVQDLSFTQSQLEAAQPRAPIVSQPVRRTEIQRASIPTGLRSPQNIGEEIASRTILSGALGIRPALTPREQVQQLRAQGATEREIQIFQAQQTGQKIIPGGGGIVARTITSRAAPSAISKVVSRLPQGERIIRIGETISTRTPSQVKSALYYGGVSVGYVAGGQATNIGKEQEANRITRELRSQNIPITKEAAKQLVEQANAYTIQRGLEGAPKQAPEVGGSDFLGMVQRFALSGAPGLTSFFAPKSAREGAQQALRSQNIPTTEKNIESVISAQKATGLFSTGGLFLTEASSELGVGRAIRKGSPALKSATTIPQQRAALRSLIVPPTAVAGAFEGATQAFNVETLTKKEARGEQLLYGAGAGSLSAGAFSLLTAQFTPTRKGRFVQALGYALDFPGEPAGDLLAKAPQRALRQEGLRIPVITFGGVTPTQARAGEGRAQARTQAKTTILPGIGRVPVDNFGLPSFTPSRTPTTPITRTPSKTTVPGLSSTPTRTPTKTNVFGFTETNVQTNVNAPSLVNIPSFTNVPVVVPDRLPLFPPGRVGEGGGAGGRRGRLGYFDEVAAVFGATLSNPFPVRSGSRAGRPRRVNRQRRSQARNPINFGGYNFFGSQKRGRRK